MYSNCTEMISWIGLVGLGLLWDWFGTTWTLSYEQMIQSEETNPTPATLYKTTINRNAGIQH